MGSVSRRLTRHLSFFSGPSALAKQVMARKVDAVTEGVLLSERLERAAKENNAADPLHFLEYLRRMRRGYDPRTDGASRLMELVDEINKFEAEEMARRKAAQS